MQNKCVCVCVFVGENADSRCCLLMGTCVCVCVYMLSEVGHGSVEAIFLQCVDARALLFMHLTVFLG